MKKYLNKIIQGDCLEVMKGLPDESIDLILTDPPYGINYEAWDKLNLEYIKKTHRILKTNGSIWIFGGWSNIAEIKEQIEEFFIVRNWVIWDRQKGRGAKYNFVSTREDIIWATKSDNYTFNKQSSNIRKKTKGMGLKNGDSFRKLSNIWTDIPPIVPWSKEKVNHPTQKPIALFKRIIEISTNKGNLVLDPFSGSGTTAVASQELGRNYIGIDISPEYCKIAEQRLAQEVLL